MATIDVNGIKAILQLVGNSGLIGHTAADINDLTEVSLTGDGVFDKLMAASKLHVIEEFEANRITKAEYAEVYLGMLQASMTNAVNFLMQWEKLGLEKALLAHQLAQAQAQLAQIELESALVKQKVVTEAAQTNDRVNAATLLADVPVAPTNKDIEGAIGSARELTDMQIESTKAQKSLYVQKVVTEIANTNDVSTADMALQDNIETKVPMIPKNSAGHAVEFTGTVGASIAVTKEQAAGFQRDAQQKVVKLMTDHVNMLVSAGTAGATDAYLADIIQGIKESAADSFNGTKGVKADSLLGKVIAQARGLNPENITTRKVNTTANQPWNPDNTDFDNDPNTPR